MTPSATRSSNMMQTLNTPVFAKEAKGLYDLILCA